MNEHKYSDEASGPKQTKREEGKTPERINPTTTTYPSTTTSASGSPIQTTLPHYSATFTQPANYRTPFDSPDPIINPTNTSGPGVPVPISIEDQGEIVGRWESEGGAHTPTTQTNNTRPTNLSLNDTDAYENVLNSMTAASVRSTEVRRDAYDPFSIFHRVPTTNTNQSQATQPPQLQKSASARVKKRPPPTAPSTNSKQSKPKSPTRPVFDPVAEAVIPDILSSRALLNRRASEPTLGSRRAAEMAAQAAAKAAAAQTSASATTTPTTATRQLQQTLRSLTIDTGEKLSTPAASDVNNLGPFQDPIGGPVTPRRKCSECSNLAFASGLCATHLIRKYDTGTPTTQIRRYHNLWSREVVSGQHLQLRWCFWKKGEQYVIQLWENEYSLERTVLVNGKVTYRGPPDASTSEWKLSMILGRSKSSAFETILGAIPREGRNSEVVANWSYESMLDVDYELWIDGFPFIEAQNNWLSELGAMQAIQATQYEDDDEVEVEGRSSDTSSSDRKKKLSLLDHQLQFESLQYIKKYWHRKTTQTKTALGYPKNTIKWNFTINGQPHELILIHSEVSGKRRIELDGETILIKKPSLLNGLLLKRNVVHTLSVGGVPFELRISRVFGLDRHHTTPGFHYELFIDRVPFQRCTKTLAEYAGGMMDVEQKLNQLQAEHEKEERREAAFKRDPRIVLTPEPKEEEEGAVEQ